MIDFKSTNNKEDGDPLNNLPEYEVRTMKDDLDRAAGKEVETKTEKLELPKLKEEIQKPKPKLETITIKESVKEPVKKAPLPSIEEFISAAPPLPPPLPPIPPNIPKPSMPKTVIPAPIPTLRPKHRKNFLFWIIMIIVAVAAGAFFYWNGIKPNPEPQPPTNNEINIPEPLIRIDGTEKTFLTNDSFLNFLKAKTSLSQTPQTIKRFIAIKNETEILSLSALIQELRIAIYPYVLSELKDNYTLGFYGQNDKKRVCLVIEVDDANKTKEQLKFWEKTMPEDLKSLFLNEKPGEPTTKSFKDNTYKGTAIRYINFPGPDLTIDYAVSNNLFILSTSKESMYQIIDRIKP